MNIYDVVIVPISTEKSEEIKWDGKYTFEVHPKSNKSEIKKAVEAIYKVEVTSVNTMIMPAKFSGSAGRRRGVRSKVWKKAIVSLAPGQRIVALEA
ncbi:MAG: 50S ribosomal protein L23 [Chloroflexota bacterium]|nr:50S ribosomal protein L23 [Chloroflexota bacterium]